MLRASRYGYTLAKIYGILSKSYLGENYRDVLRLKKLADLYALLSKGAPPSQPDHQLAVDLEARIVQGSIQIMGRVLGLLGSPVPILVHILRRFEYQGLKSVLRGMVRGRLEEARVWDLGEYAGVRLAGAQDYEKAIRESPYAWVLPLIADTNIVQIENRLDHDYYATLLSLARRLPHKDRGGVLRLVTTEMSLANAVWALRLRFFFGMGAESAGQLLLPRLVDAQRKAVQEAFEIPADSIEGWRAWRYGWLLEDQLGESFQAPDPVRAEQQASRRLYERAHQLFHQDPFTLTPLVAFFKLKEYETNMLQTAVEALHLSIPEQEILSLAGAP